MILLLLVAAALLASVPGGFAASRPVPTGFVGMTLDGPLLPGGALYSDLPHQLDLMVASGVETVRLPVFWSTLQPYKTFNDVPSSDPRSFVAVAGADGKPVPTWFDQLDSFVALAAARHLSVLPVLVDAPKWASNGVTGVFTHTPAGTGPFAALLKGLVERYGPRGSFWRPGQPKWPIRMWQIWNEPYIPGYWSQQPWPRTYVALLRASHAALQSVDPGGKIVLAGLANDVWGELAQIYRVRGSRRSFDVVAVHPYTQFAGGVITILQYVRQVMDQYGDRHKPIDVTELGWPSSCARMVGSNQDCVKWKTRQHFGWEADESGQAQRLRSVLPLLAANRVALGVIGFDYYTWANQEYRGAFSFNFAGLLRIPGINGTVFEPKPAYYAFKSGALALEHCAQKGATATACVRPAR